MRTSILKQNINSITNLILDTSKQGPWHTVNT